MKDYNHLCFQTNNISQHVGHRTSLLLVKAQKKDTEQCQKDSISIIQFFPKYVLAITKTEQKKPKPNLRTTTTKSSGDNVYAKHLDNG